MAQNAEKLTCSISVCRNYKNPSSVIDLYPLPTQNLHREMWCKTLGIPLEEGEKPTARVCALHFRSKMGLPPQSVDSSRPAEVSRSIVPRSVQNEDPFCAILVNDGRRGLLRKSCVIQTKNPMMTSMSSLQPSNMGSILTNPSLPASPNLSSGSDNSSDQISQALITNPLVNLLPTSIISETDENSTLHLDSFVGDTNCHTSNKIVHPDHMTLELECEDDPLNTAQLNAYMKDLMAFLSANEIVYRLAQNNASKLPSSGEGFLQNIGLDNSKVHSLLTANHHIDISNAFSSSSQQNPVGLSPNISTGNVISSLAPSLVSPHLVQVNSSSAAASNTGKTSSTHILDLNMNSRLTPNANNVGGNNPLSVPNSFILSSNAQLGSSATPVSSSSSKSPQLIHLIPSTDAATSTSTLSFQNINTVNTIANTSNNNNSGGIMKMIPTSLMQNKIVGSGSEMPLLSSALSAPVFHLVPPVSSSVNTTATSNISSLHLSSTNSSQKPQQSITTSVNALPSQQIQFLKITPSTTRSLDESVKLNNNNTSCTLQAYYNLNPSKEPLRGFPVVNPVGVEPVLITPSLQQLLSEKPKGPQLPPFNLFSKMAMDSVEAKRQSEVLTAEKSVPKQLITGLSADEILPLPSKNILYSNSPKPSQTPTNNANNTSSTTTVNVGDNTNFNDTQDSSGSSSPLPLVPLVEYREGDEVISDGTSANLPVIVNILGATEGGTEFFGGDKIPDTSLHKSKKDVIESSVTDSSNMLVNHSDEKKTDSDFSSQFVMYNTSKGEVLVSKRYSLLAIQRYKTITTVTSGLEKFTDQRKFFSIKCQPPKNRLDDANTLRQKLKKEDYILKSFWWLHQRKLLPPIHMCVLCGNKVFTLDRNEKFQDNFCWTCTNGACRNQVAIRRPTFFERSSFLTLEDLLLLTYHWASQSYIEEILTDVNIELDKILCYFTSLQQICNDVMIKKGVLGGLGSIVETAVAKLGKFFILGALDRRTRCIRLEVLNEEEALGSMKAINILSSWLQENCVLVSDQKVPNNIIRGVETFEARANIADPTSPKPHILNISKYLNTQLYFLFGKANHKVLSKEFIQGFLYELQWRNKFGRDVDSAFWNIFSHISDLNLTEATKSKAMFLPGDMNHDNFVKKMSTLLKRRWGPTTISSSRNNSSTSSTEPYVFSQAPPPVLIPKEVNSYSKPYTTTPGSKLPQQISELFQDVPEVPGGSAYITSKRLLSIKIRFDESDHDSNSYNSDAIQLGLRLRTEGFIRSPVRWLVRKGYIKSSSPCYVCQSTSFLRDNPKFSDGCSWSCQNIKCRFENVFKRPQFFARFPQYPMAHISAMIFHWTVQSDIAIITTDAPMDIAKISHAWRAFQVLCSSTLKRERVKIGGVGVVVELAVVQYGRMYIVGAWDRRTRSSLLRAIPVEKKFQIISLYHMLQAWILPGTCVVVNASKHFQMPSEFYLAPADISITDKRSSNHHVLNITGYLLNNISFMFGHVKAELIRHELMQIYLDELMWRERFGRKPQFAFSKIMNEIFFNEITGKSSRDAVSPEDQDNSQSTFNVSANHVAPLSLKELRIVLQRIPKTVLKYYKCLPPDDFTECDASEPEPKKRKLDSSNMEPVHVMKDDKEVDIVVIDDDGIPESAKPPEKCVPKIKKEPSVDNELLKISPNQSVSDRNSGSAIHQNSSENGAPSSISKNKTHGTNSVQKLVINVCRKNKKPKFFIKSDLSPVTTSNENSLDSSTFEKSLQNIEDSKSSEDTNSQFFKVSSAMETSNFQTLNSRTYKRRTSSQRRPIFDGRPECIECGEPISWDHFMKKYICTDCKRSVYNTCCSNAFVEHRSSLLFGKRRPRRYKEHKGLHRKISLRKPWCCPCGFSSKQGNILASHMVNCQQITCYSNLK